MILILMPWNLNIQKEWVVEVWINRGLRGHWELICFQISSSNRECRKVLNNRSQVIGFNSFKLAKGRIRILEWMLISKRGCRALERALIKARVAVYSLTCIMTLEHRDKSLHEASRVQTLRTFLGNGQALRKWASQHHSQSLLAPVRVSPIHRQADSP